MLDLFSYVVGLTVVLLLGFAFVDCQFVGDHSVEMLILLFSVFIH